MPPTESTADPSRRTLLVGGTGIVLGSVIPLITQALFLVQLPGTSWLYVFEDTPLLGTLSAVILIAALVVLAVGIGGEPGIAGPSVAGRAALIVFGVASIATSGYSTMAAMTPEAGPVLAMLVAVVNLSLTALWVASLIVAAVFVARAGVVRGVARWGLLVLAALTVLDLLASRIPSDAAIGVWIWGFVALRAVQLLIGVLYVVQALTAAPGREAPVATGYAR
ncbi:hypothetical protein ACIRCZ_04040 [Leifsonia sp. NPDC102414]|uniref:hypothetical protein n=1 Tax=Leifsonia sp. NPDC102414 TaxID=3364124 RepID=UPI003804E1B3